MRLIFLFSCYLSVINFASGLKLFNTCICSTVVGTETLERNDVVHRYEGKVQRKMSISPGAFAVSESKHLQVET